MKEGKIAGYEYHLNPPVFFIAAALIIGSVLLSFIFLQYIGNVFGTLQTFISDNAGWFYILVMNLGLLFCFFLLFSRFGGVRLGGADAKPEFSTPDWFAMLFSAGMGIGLLFYGVAEPMFHFVAPPVGDPATADAARKAMYLTFLHWGLHPWAIYAVVGLSLAFCNFNMGLPLTIRTAFYPLLKERIH
ncbi:MAG: BCCT family transporter, partial [bacterium]|nr:BCCT family transporter [bacterium]